MVHRTLGRKEKCIQNFNQKTGRKVTGDLGINGIVKLKCEHVDWVHPNQDRG
jgi:hypothetical protein